MRPSSEFKPGGLPVTSVNILRLLSELEGSYQLTKYMGFYEDMEVLDNLKKKYYSKYVKLNKEEKGRCPSG